MFLKELAEEEAFQTIRKRVDMFSKNADEQPVKEPTAEDEDDRVKDGSIALKTDTRKTRLTIEQIHRLRKLKDLKITEYQKNILDIKSQYKPPAEGGDAGGL